MAPTGPVAKNVLSLTFFTCGINVFYMSMPVLQCTYAFGGDGNVNQIGSCDTVGNGKRVN